MESCMKIATRIEFQLTAEGMEEIYREEFFYEGPLAMCGGGPSKEQSAAAASQGRLTDQLGRTAAQQEAYMEAQRNKTTPFYTDLMNNGPAYTNQALDAAGGTNAQAFAPARADLIRRLGASTGLPSGSREQSLTDFNNQEALGYDNSLMSIRADQQAARERGAAGIMGEAQQSNPLGYYQGAMGGNSSIMNANLRRPGLGGVLGGLAGGAMNAAATYYGG